MKVKYENKNRNTEFCAQYYTSADGRTEILGKTVF